VSYEGSFSVSKSMKQSKIAILVTHAPSHSFEPRHPLPPPHELPRVARIADSLPSSPEPVSLSVSGELRRLRGRERCLTRRTIENAQDEARRVKTDAVIGTDASELVYILMRVLDSTTRDLSTPATTLP